MIVSIHQPDYIPYIGLFHKIANSDVFVFLDDAQFGNNMHHWNRIKTPQGEFRLKIPVDYKFGDFINQVRTKDELGWKRKHLKVIEMSYARAKYFKEIYPKFKELLSAEYQNLAEQNITINKWICEKLGLTPQFYKTSEMNIHSVREQRNIDIVVQLGGDEYLSGNGAKAYQNEEHFSSKGIKLRYTDYQPIEYPQLWKEFLPNMSILDYLFNCGFDWEFVEKTLKAGSQSI